MLDSERLIERMQIIGEEVIRTNASPKDYVGAFVVADALLEVARQLALIREKAEESSATKIKQPIL